MSGLLTLPDSGMASEGFYGCCGACVFYLGNHTFVDHFRKWLPKLLDQRKETKSIGFVMLNSTQNEYVGAFLQKEFGFVLLGKPIKNINTKVDLYTYQIDLNEYRKKAAKPVEKATFARTISAPTYVNPGIGMTLTQVQTRARRSF